jgi:tetratricopeptide (TPR) repeat protein
MIKVILAIVLLVVVIGLSIIAYIISRPPTIPTITLDSITPIQDWKYSLKGKATGIKKIAVEIENPKGRKFTPKSEPEIKKGKIDVEVPLFDVDEKMPFKESEQFIEGKYKIIAKSIDPKKQAENSITVTVNLPESPKISASFDTNTRKLTGTISSVAEYRASASGNPLSIDENGGFSIDVDPKKTSEVIITAVNWAGKSSQISVQIPPSVVILKLNEVTLHRNDPRPQVVSVSGSVEANYLPAKLSLIQLGSWEKKISSRYETFIIESVQYNSVSDNAVLEAIDRLGTSSGSKTVPKNIVNGDGPEITLDPVYVINIPVSFPITVEVHGRATDDLGIASVRLISPYPSNDVTLEGDGRFTVTVQIRSNEDWNNITIRATDRQGNHTDATVRIIRVRLQITVVPPPDITNQTQISIRGRVEVADPYRHLLPTAIQRITVRFPPFRFPSDGNFEFTADLPIEGRNVIRFPLDSREFPVIRDTIPPKIQVTTPQPDQVITETSVDVTGQVIEANLEGLYINDERVTDQPGAFSRKVSGLGSGRQNISIKALDKANNPPTNTQIEIMVDLEKPKIEVINPPKNKENKKVYVGDSVKIIVKATDDTQVTRVEISGKGIKEKMELDDAQTGQFKYPFNATAEQIGELRLSVTAFDLANRPSESEKITVEVERKVEEVKKIVTSRSTPSGGDEWERLKSEFEANLQKAGEHEKKGEIKEAGREYQSAEESLKKMEIEANTYEKNAFVYLYRAIIQYKLEKFELAIDTIKNQVDSLRGNLQSRDLHYMRYYWAMSYFMLANYEHGKSKRSQKQEALDKYIEEGDKKFKEYFNGYNNNLYFEDENAKKILEEEFKPYLETAKRSQEILATFKKKSGK